MTRSGRHPTVTLDREHLIVRLPAVGVVRLLELAAGAGVITILSGVLLYWHDFWEIVPFNPSMAGFAVGGVAAIALLVIGISMATPLNRRLAGSPPRATVSSPS